MEVLEVIGDEMVVVSAEVMEQDWDFERLLVAEVAG